MTQGSETKDGSAALKRRGLIAAGAGLVAGAFTEVLAKPAAAAHDNTNVLHLDETNKATKATSIEGERASLRVVKGASDYVNILGPDEGDHSITCFAKSGMGVYSVSHAQDAVFGYTLQAGGSGVSGGTVNHRSPAVRGYSYAGAYTNPDGIFRAGIGVEGESYETRVSQLSYGVVGRCLLAEGKGQLGNGVGVLGESATIGVRGEGGSVGVFGHGHWGVSGRSTVVADDAFGVSGDSSDGVGVRGVSTRRRGVQGKGGSVGVYGESDDGNGVKAFSAHGDGLNATGSTGIVATGTAGTACVFNGSVRVRFGDIIL